MASFTSSAVPGAAVPGAAIPGSVGISSSGVSTATSLLTLTNTASAAGVTAPGSAASTLSLTNTASAAAKTARTAASTISLTSTAAGGLRGQAASTIVLTNTATSNGLGYGSTATATLTLTNTATAALRGVGQATSTLTLTATTVPGTLRTPGFSTSLITLANTAVGNPPAFAASLITVVSTALGIVSYAQPTPPPVVVPDWRELTPAALAILLAATNPSIDTGLELLDFTTLDATADLSGSLDVSTGDVQWSAAAQPNRDCDLTITTALAWGAVVVRVYRVMSDPVSGVTARFNRGGFCLTTPDTVLGTTVTGVDGTEQLSYAVTGQDRTSLLDRLLPDSYTVAAGTNVVAAIAQAFTDAGLSGYLIDSTADDATVPSDMVWPLVPNDSDTTASSVTLVDGTVVDDSGQATWRTVVNDLASLVTYGAVWADDDAQLRVGPYVDPAQRPATQTLDATSPLSTLGVERTVSGDVYGVPNRWTFVWANIPDGVDSNGDATSTTPTVENGGVYIRDNVDVGPSSQTARNGLVYPAPNQSLTAASPADLQAQGDAIVAAALRVTTTITTTVAPNPSLGHRDIATFTDTGFDGVTAAITSWTESFTNSDTEITAEVAA